MGLDVVLIYIQNKLFSNIFVYFGTIITFQAEVDWRLNIKGQKRIYSWNPLQEKGMKK